MTDTPLEFRDMPEIEPLSELEWRRIESGLFARVDAGEAEVEPAATGAPPRRRWGRVVAGIGLSAAAAVALVMVWPGEGEPDATRTSRIATADASTQVTAGDVALTVEPHSAVVVNEGDAGVGIVLERGAVRCAVAPRDARPPVRVFAGEVTIEVVGTVFAVSRTGDTASVEVERGTVAIVYRGERALVGEGESWPARRAAASDGEPAEPLVMDPDVVRRRRTRARTNERAAQPPAADPATSDEPSAKERFAVAARLEASDPDAAVAVYRELAGEGGPWAAPALFARGRLEAELGREPAARRTLTRYLERFPRGGNVADARALLESME